MTRRNFPLTPELHHHDLYDQARRTVGQIDGTDWGRLPVEVRTVLGLLDALIAGADATTGERVGSNSAISDPTISLLLARLGTDARVGPVRILDDYLGHLTEGISHIRAAWNIGARITRQAGAHELEQLKKAVRCTAAPDQAMQPWVRPECQDLAVKDGLCGACYQRRYRYRDEQRDTAA